MITTPPGELAMDDACDRGPHHALPGLRTVLASVAGALLTAVVVPATLLWSTLQVLGVVPAVIAVLAWTVAVMGWRRATGRPLSGLLVLSLGILVVKSGFTLLTGDTFVYFVQPVVTDALVATVFLGSLWTARPAIARLAPEFYPLTAPVAARPRICALFRRLTLMWGVVILVKAALTLWLLETLATADFVLVKGGAILTLTAAAVTATVVWSHAVVRREGLLPG